MGDVGSDERVSAAQMVVKEVEWDAIYSFQPQREFGEFHGEGISVHAVDARLDDAPFPVRQIAGLGGRVGCHCLGKEGCRLHQEVRAAHGGIADVEIQDGVREGVGRSVLHVGILSDAFQKRRQGGVHDVRHPILRRVVRALRFAFALLVGEFDDAAFGKPPQRVFEKSLVDAAQMPLAQPGIIERGDGVVVLGAERQAGQGGGDVCIRRPVRSEKGIFGGVEQSAVVSRDVQPFVLVAVVAIDEPEQSAESFPQDELPVVVVLFGVLGVGESFAEGVQTVGQNVLALRVGGQQIAGFGVQHEQNSVQKDERIFVDAGQIGVGEFVFGAFQKPAPDDLGGIEDLFA